MDHYLAYQNADDFGQFKGSTFFTAKRLRRETLVGSRLWIFEGAGTPRRYFLVSSGIIRDCVESERPLPYRRSGQEMGINVEFLPDIDYRVDLTEKAWFRDFVQEQQNFRYGLSKISDSRVIVELEGLRAEARSGTAEHVLDDIDAIEKDPSLSPTSKKCLVDARLGQGVFRNRLIARWGSTCSVTGCAVSAVLRASHIKPWRLCTNEERLDPANGLLLAAHLDALFDVGLISFSDIGEMILAPYLPLPDRQILGLPRSLRKELTGAERKYLLHHREQHSTTLTASAASTRVL